MHCKGHQITLRRFRLATDSLRKGRAAALHQINPLHNKAAFGEPQEHAAARQIADHLRPAPSAGPPPAMAAPGGSQDLAGNVSAATQALLTKLEEDLPTIVSGSRCRAAFNAAAPSLLLPQRTAAAAPRFGSGSMHPEAHVASHPAAAEQPDVAQPRAACSGLCDASGSCLTPALCRACPCPAPRFPRSL